MLPVYVEAGRRLSDIRTGVGYFSTSKLVVDLLGRFWLPHDVQESIVPNICDQYDGHVRVSFVSPYQVWLPADFAVQRRRLDQSDAVRYVRLRKFSAIGTERRLYELGSGDIATALPMKLYRFSDGRCALDRCTRIYELGGLGERSSDDLGSGRVWREGDDWYGSGFKDVPVECVPPGVQNAGQVIALV